jgi:abortive infection bacteriophage resistance protein
VADARFDDVVRLYEFDRKLRTPIHDAIERIEVARRSHLSYRIGSIRPLAYRNAATCGPTFDHDAWYDRLFAKDQWAIAERLGIAIDDSDLNANQRNKVRKAHPLARWLEQLTVLRNTCANHSRVWNRSFTPVSTTALRTISDLGSLPNGQSERLYGALTVMTYLLQGTSPGTSWPTKVRSLIDDSFINLPERTVEEMGFPERWHEERFWSDA